MMAGKQQTKPAVKFDVVDSTKEPSPASAPGKEVGRGVKMGDIVIYCQPSMRAEVGKANFVHLPFMVTRVHKDQSTVDGIAFATSHVSFQGQRLLYDISFGDQESCWRWKD